MNLKTFPTDQLLNDVSYRSIIKRLGGQGQLFEIAGFFSQPMVMWEGIQQLLTIIYLYFLACSYCLIWLGEPLSVQYMYTHVTKYTRKKRTTKHNKGILRNAIINKATRFQIKTSGPTAIFNILVEVHCMMRKEINRIYSTQWLHWSWSLRNLHRNCCTQSNE